MLRFSEIYEVDGSIFKCDYNQFSPASLYQTDTKNDQFF